MQLECRACQEVCGRGSMLGRRMENIEMNGAPTAMPLHLSNKHRMIAGVCGGIADWLGWSPTLVRVAYVLLSVLSAGFPGILVYIILWIVMPRAR